MREKKCAILICVFMIVMCSVIYIMLQFNVYFGLKEWLISKLPMNAMLLKETVKDICMGVMTGAIATGILSYSEYNIQKRKSIKDYIEANDKLINNFYKIPCFYTEEPTNLVVAYLTECQNNKLAIEYNDSLVNAIGDVPNKKEILKKHSDKIKITKSDAKKELIEWLWENTDDSIKDLNDDTIKKKKFLEEQLEEKVKKITEEITFFIEQCNLILRLSLFEIHETYGSFAFFNESFFDKEITQKVHNFQLDFLPKIKRKVDAINKAYCEKSYVHIFRTIKELEDELFFVKDGIPNMIIYKKYCYEMEKRLNELSWLLQKKKKRSKEPELSCYSANVYISKEIANEWFLEYK